jgi:hypothetical protein
MGFGSRFVPAAGVHPVVKDGAMTQASAWPNRDTAASPPGVATTAWPNRDSQAPSPGVSTSAWGNEDAGALVSTSVEVA